MRRYEQERDGDGGSRRGFERDGIFNAVPIGICVLGLYATVI